MTIKRSKHVAIGLTVFGASTILTGCSSNAPDYQAICVDPVTQERVDDDQCDDDDTYYTGSGGGYYWFYMSSTSSSRLPAVGEGYSTSAGTYDGKSLASSGKRIGRGVSSSGSSSVSSYTKSTSKSGGFGGSGFSRS